MRVVSVVLTASILSLSINPGAAQDISNHAIVQKYISAQDPKQAGEAFEKLFYEDPEEEEPHFNNEVLANCEHAGIALQAAWRMHVRELPEKSAYFGVLPVNHYLPDVQRFVGVVEGRLKVQTPLWWEEMLESPDKHHPSRMQGRTNRWDAIPDLDSDSIAIEAGSKSISLPTATLQWLTEENRSHQFTTAVESGNVLVVSRPKDAGFPRIACIEIASGTERWRNQMWGNAVQRSFFSGPPVTRVDVISLALSNDTITIFGAYSDKLQHLTGDTFINSAFYIEQFSITDGACRVRFATDNWGVRLD